MKVLAASRRWRDGWLAAWLTRNSTACIVATMVGGEAGLEGGPRRRRVFGAALASLLVLGPAACSGDLFHDTSWADGGSGPGASATSASADGSTAGGGEGPSPCPEGASPLDEPCAIDESRGLFVRPEGRDGATGTRDDPLRTIDEAAGRAAGGIVFVCAGTYRGPIEVPAGGWVVGGLACDQPGWPLGADVTRIEAASDSIPLRLGPGPGEARLERLAIAAADAVRPGASSIAVLAESDVLVRACEVVAGAGADGAAGEAGAPSAEVGSGAPGDPACLAGGSGGDPGRGPCGAGGRGGDGSLAGAAGEDGATPAGDLAGDGGDGQPSGSGWSCTAQGHGGDGGVGSSGDHGPGATLPGALGTGGFEPVAGGDGAAGRPGGAGGGGGGTRGTASCRGASGGGGGAGGCGGAGGLGGQGGGGSFAIAALGARVTVVGGRLAVARGGGGGDGGPGADGGAGGIGGAGGAGDAAAGIAQGCRGGDGGAGGRGGDGGGGRGGHAAAVLYAGVAPSIEGDVAVVLPEATGPGGRPPAEGAAVEHGVDGIVAVSLEVPPGT